MTTPKSEIVNQKHPPEQREGSEVRMRRVLSFATITAIGFALGKLSGVLREIVVSASFGLSSDLDAYFIAYTVPTIINNVIAGGTITAAIMPTLAHYLAQNDREGFWRVLSVITNIVLLITGGLTLLVMFLPSPVIALVGAGFPADTQTLAANLLVIMMPTLALGALLTMLLAALNALDRFVASASIFLALNLGIIVTVLLLAPTLGVAAVAWGFLIGVALQVAIQFIELRRERPQFFGRLDWRHPALAQVWRAFLPIAALSILAQINYVIDKTMATMLPAGSVGALYYADSILGLFYMLGISLGIGVFPSLSRLAAENNLDGTARAVTTSLRLLIFILAPLTFLLIVFAVPTIGLILGRGKFDLTAVDLTAHALVMFAIGLLAVAALNVLQRTFYALSDSVTPFAVGTFTLLLHIGLNLILMQSMAHAGIALSASLSSIAGAITLTLLLARRLPSIDFAGLGKFLLQSTIVALASTLAVAGLFAGLNLAGESMSARIIGVAFAACGGAIYFGAALLLRMPESRMLLDLGLGFVRRLKREGAP